MTAARGSQDAAAAHGRRPVIRHRGVCGGLNRWPRADPRYQIIGGGIIGAHSVVAEEIPQHRKDWRA